MNTFGRLFRITTFGESHGAALGCIVDGCPANIPVDENLLLSQLDRRRPGQSKITTSRPESDTPEILSGIFQGKTLGTPVAMMVRNTAQKSSDYNEIKHHPRRGHADQVWKDKFGHVDHRGGGRSSGRETVSRVMGGWLAECLLKYIYPELKIAAFVSQVGTVAMSQKGKNELWSRDQVDVFASRCPEEKAALAIEKMLEEAKEKGDSYGGEIILRVSGMPASLGEPVFMKLQNYLAGALASIATINSINWNELPLDTPGSSFHIEDNNYSGINGGISNGGNLIFRMFTKPVSTIGDVAKKGRHDPCILPRAVPVVESMAALVLADLALINQSRKLEVQHG